MAQSDTEICNLALSHLGNGKEIQSLETDPSEEAIACRRVYSIARDATLRDFAWPFARAFATLAVVETNPTTEWGFSYRYPANCFMARRIFSGVRNDSRQTKISYLIGGDDEGGLIYTDQPTAELEYTLQITDVTRFQPDFVMALSFRIAALIAAKLTGGDPFKVGQSCYVQHEKEISKARANSVNEEQQDQEVESEFVRSRQGFGFENERCPNVPV